MKITIHRGSREIGGVCIQVQSGDRSILLDAGSPLGESLSTVDLNALDFSDIVISHPHQDHFDRNALLGNFRYASRIRSAFF